MDPLGRFWAKVEKTEGCWFWTASTIKGYGQFRATATTKVSAHRFAYELLVGPIPDGLTLDHLCRNRNCVRPAHLEPVSSGVNTLRGEGRAARHARQPVCHQGHPFTPENTYRPPSRLHTRQCRACQTTRLAERYRLSRVT